MAELLVQVRRGLSKAANEAERLGKIGRLKLEIVNLQRKRSRALRRAGEAVYQFVGAGTLAVPEDVETHLAQVREFEAEMAAKRAEAASLKAKPHTASSGPDTDS